MKADIFIQAGYEGRTSGNTGSSGPLGNEIDWTPSWTCRLDTLKAKLQEAAHQ